MAILHDTKSDLKIRCNAYKWAIRKVRLRQLSLILVMLIVGYIGIRSCMTMDVLPLFLSVIIFIFHINSLYLYKINKTDYANYKKTKHGIVGEDLISKMLCKKLPDTYHILKNIIAGSSNSKAEIDIVVIGETGVFIIEIKNWKGKITGDVSDIKWRQKKTSTRNKLFTEKYDNPLKQIKRQWRCLTNFLEDNNIEHSLKSSLLFSGDKTSIEIIGKTNIPIFLKNDNGVKKIIDFIINNTQIKLYNKSIETITKLLVSNNQ